MDFKKQAEAALEEARSLTEQMRSVNDDGTLGDAEKRSQVEKMGADADAKRDEARSYIEQGERENEVRTLSERAGKLTAPSTEARADADKDTFADELRELGRGDRKLVEARADGATLERMLFEARTVPAALTTQTANAGTTVATTFVAQLLESLRETSPILQAGVKIITTASGEQMDWPVRNGHITASRVTEGATYSQSNQTFTRTSLHAWKYGVIAEASIEMIQDSALDIVNLIATDAGESLAFATNHDFLLGSGSSQPQGLLTGITLGATMAAAAPTFNDLIGLQHSVTPKYRKNAAFYTGDGVVLALRLIKDTTGRYIWQDSVNVGQPDSLLGKPVFIDPNMPTGLSAKSVAFGDFGRAYVVRFARTAEVVRSDEYGFDTDIVAFKARVRVDGAVQDGAAVAALTTPSS